jgi:hypothetical protein
MNIPALAPLVSPKGIKPETNYDKIFKAWLDDSLHTLPDELKQQLERWKKCNALMRDGQTIKKGKNDIVRPYRYNDLVDYLVREFGITKRTAYNDIAHTKRFFLTAETKEEVDFAKGIYLEWLERWMHECASTGDHKSATAYAKLIKEVRGFDKINSEMPDYKDIQVPHLILVADPSELGFPKVDNPDQVVQKILNKRKKSNLDRVIDGMAESAELAQIVEDIQVKDDTDSRTEEDLA